MKKRKMSEKWNMGTEVALCAGVGIVLGALVRNVVLWLCIGAGTGVVLGAVSKNKKPQDKITRQS